MKKQGPTKLCFKPRGPQKPRKKREETKYPWVRNPQGRVMKLLIGLIGDNVAGPSLVFERNFSEQGATGERLYGELTRICPFAVQEYESKAGVPLTPHIVFQRYHKMYYKNGKRGKGGVPEPSPEHYSRSPKLKPLIGPVDAIFRAGKPITFEQAVEAGAL